ncbi:Similar to Delta-latroinsectotoxin-Lt1a; acc. no. Q25338 [Pyronema omphalodes CBS 100304]|uniref:Similar to Delta-latroinsectotoxin-Lt1a acc. no. Q25338 n=1 Tax=Pyronema omphalodes (strain CBS 100304) TaxID=1076935 RepID=U4LGR5_PYROM|nr:Similar to Delta-latroinsectotoxin-Lt1a; acc. no. Q25338 [Pyronema omphalodes CBS 100304]
MPPDAGFCGPYLPLNDVSQEHLAKYCLLRYAIKNWGYHYSEDSPDVTLRDLAVLLFRRPPPPDCISRTFYHLAMNNILTTNFKCGVEFEDEAIPKQVEINCGLHVAAYFGKTAMMEILLERLGDNVDLEWFGHTPIRLAVVEGHVDPVRVLLRRGADIAQVFAYSRYSLLHLAVRQSEKEVVRVLLDNGADVNSRGLTTPLHNAISGRMMAMNYEIVNTIIEKCADINLRKLLLKPDIDVNCTDVSEKSCVGVRSWEHTISVFG